MRFGKKAFPARSRPGAFIMREPMEGVIGPGGYESPVHHLQFAATLIQYDWHILRWRNVVTFGEVGGLRKTETP